MRLNSLLKGHLNKFLNFFIYSNYFIASCAGIVCLQVVINSPEVKARQLSTLFLFVFFSTHFSYNIHRLLGAKPKDVSYISQRQYWHNNHILFQWISTLLSAIFCILFAFSIGITKLFILAPVAFISVFYNLKFFRLPLRNLPGIKLFLIAFTWAYTSTVFPVFVTNTVFSVPVLLLEFGRQFLFIVAITIPFDIRDLHYDPKDLKTIPQLIGIDKSKWLSALLLFTALICDTFIHKPYYLISDSITFIFCLFLIKESSPHKSDRYYLLWMDGMIILQSILVFGVYYLQK